MLNIIIKTVNLLKTLLGRKISVCTQNILAAFHVAGNKKSAIFRPLNHVNVPVSVRASNNKAAASAVNNPTSMNQLMERIFAEPHKIHDYTSGGFVPPLTMPNEKKAEPPPIHDVNRDSGTANHEQRSKIARKTDTMKTHILRQTKPVEPQKSMRPPRPKPAAPVTTKGIRLFIATASWRHEGGLAGSSFPWGEDLIGTAPRGVIFDCQ
jgi:hypothetical protein